MTAPLLLQVMNSLPVMISLERIERELDHLNEQSRWTRVGVTLLLVGIGFLCRDPISTAYHDTCDELTNRYKKHKAAKKERRIKRLKAELRRLEESRD